MYFICIRQRFCRFVIQISWVDGHSQCVATLFLFAHNCWHTRRDCRKINAIRKSNQNTFTVFVSFFHFLYFVCFPTYSSRFKSVSVSLKSEFVRMMLEFYERNNWNGGDQYCRIVVVFVVAVIYCDQVECYAFAEEMEKDSKCSISKCCWLHDMEIAKKVRKKPSHRGDR